MVALMAADVLQLNAARHSESSLMGKISSAVADHMRQIPDTSGRRPVQQVRAALARLSADPMLVRQLAAFAAAPHSGLLGDSEDIIVATTVIEVAGPIEAAVLISALPERALSRAVARIASLHPEAICPVINLALRRTTLRAPGSVPDLVAAASLRCMSASAWEVQGIAREALLSLADIVQATESPASCLQKPITTSAAGPTKSENGRGESALCEGIVETGRRPEEQQAVEALAALVRMKTTRGAPVRLGVRGALRCGRGPVGRWASSASSPSPQWSRAAARRAPRRTCCWIVQSVAAHGAATPWCRATWAALRWCCVWPRLRRRAVESPQLRGSRDGGPRMSASERRRGARAERSRLRRSAACGSRARRPGGGNSGGCARLRQRGSGTGTERL